MFGTTYFYLKRAQSPISVLVDRLGDLSERAYIQIYGENEKVGSDVHSRFHIHISSINRFFQS